MFLAPPCYSSILFPAIQQHPDEENEENDDNRQEFALSLVERLQQHPATYEERYDMLFGPNLHEHNSEEEEEEEDFEECDVSKCEEFRLLTLTKKCREKNWSWVWVNGDCRHDHQSHQVASQPIDGCAPKESV